jgi:hypothetical protein
MSSPAPTIVYRLRVELLDSDPPIWRSLWVAAETELEQLHAIVSAVMGWSGEADYQIKAQNVHFTGNSALGSGVSPVRLPAVMSSVGDSLIYTYDPHRGWLHKITLEAVQRAEPGLETPHCDAGERHCPPEFCVGVWGYEDILERIDDPEEPERDTLWEQLGYDFDPEKCDLAAANQRLQRLTASP